MRSQSGCPAVPEERLLWAEGLAGFSSDHNPHRKGNTGITMTKQKGTKTMAQTKCVTCFYVISGDGGGGRVCLWKGNPVFPRERAGEGSWTCGDGGNLDGGEVRSRLCSFPEAIHDLGLDSASWFALVSLT